jgi:hypothetical protein
VMCVVQCASAADGDESRIAFLGKDHSSHPSTRPRAVKNCRTELRWVAF